MTTVVTRAPRPPSDSVAGVSESFRCVVVASYGKSGSKRLLRILDFNPGTHCRNEPYGLRGSAFARLSRRLTACRTLDEARAALLDEWTATIQQTHRSMGDRDRLPSPPKAYTRALSVRLGAMTLISSKRIRRTLSLVFPALAREEWPAPRLIWDREALSRSALVLKLNHASGVAPVLVSALPAVPVVHLVRHPGAMLYSWGRRLFSVSDAPAVTQASRARLRAVGEREPAWGARFGNADTMSAPESELWYWRYTVETLHAAGQGRSNYLLIRDEDVVADPERAAERVYAFAGIGLDQQTRAHLTHWAPHWQSRTSSWRDLVSTDDAQLVERVMADSPVRSWWDHDQHVSRIDYGGV